MLSFSQGCFSIVSTTISSVFLLLILFFFFFNDTATTEIYTLSLHDALPISASSEFLYDDEDGKEHKGLGYVDFHIRPHLNSPAFPKVTLDSLKKLAPKFDGKFYALDDDSGIVFIDGKIEVISEGKCEKYN